ncbi:GNAT family N-acetyltransferase [Fictibacillus sp. BK138]|uniref:GNAT family N-acetyltransferase n=1 Tax=Fictibacillus sp. BK138 TaxID=2512121 RepID=UPI001028A9B4|nr:GNAT family N-acetyltransferase [Fictibacillus sp. BK138]RZT15517.1 acetyltransferase (GNAT) family protein [Fictibacillus sp. BK138]
MIRLRDVNLPEDYEGISRLLNLIEPGSTNIDSLKQEDQNIPQTNKLVIDENNRLVGFGRTRIVAESNAGIVGYGVVWRTPWTEPGQLSSLFCVHPSKWGRGIGSMIVKELEKWGLEQGASVFVSELKDWIPNSLPFAAKHGYKKDAHVFDLVLDLMSFEPPEENTINEIKLIPLTEAMSDANKINLYNLYIETMRDNPGALEFNPPFDEWLDEQLPEDRLVLNCSFVAIAGGKYVGITTIFNTDEPGVYYTDYTGVLKDYRGKGIARSLKLKSIHSVISLGGRWMKTETEENNFSMQHLNRDLGYIPGKGAFRIMKPLHKVE